MSSFRVSSSFNSYETMSGVTLLVLFQFVMLYAAETRSKKCKGVHSFTVSVVSIYIHSVNETHKVLAASSRACVRMLVNQQHSTRQGAA